MVEIKKTPAGQSILNRRIGVVNKQTGKEDVYRAQANAFFQLSQSGMRLASTLGRAEAKEYAMGAPLEARDENGNLLPAELPDDIWFGRAGRADAKQILDQRYLAQWELDTREQLQNFAKNSPNDPDGLNILATGLFTQTQAMLKEQGDEGLANKIGELGYPIAGEYALKLEQNKAGIEGQLLADNVRQKHDAMVNDFALRVANGDVSFSDAKALIDQESKNAQVFFNVTSEYAGDFRRRFSLASFERVVSATFPKMSTSEINAAIGGLMAVDKDSAIAKEQPELFKIFEEMPQQTRTQAEGHMAKVRQNVEAQNKATKEAMQSLRNVNAGLATADDVTTVLEQAQLSGFNMLRTEKTREQAVEIMKAAGSLDKEIIKITQEILSGRSYDNQNPGTDALVLQTVFSALQNDRTFQGVPSFNTQMGLNASEVNKIDYLASAFDQGPDRFASALTTIATLDTTYEVVNAIVPDEYQGKTLFDVSSKVFDHPSFSDLSPAAKRDMRNVLLDSLVLNRNFDTAVDATREAYDKYYTESEYSEFATRDAPEARFPELSMDKDHRYNFWTYAIESFKGDRRKAGTIPTSRQEAQELAPRNPFKSHVNKLLSLSTASDLTVEDVWLDVDHAKTDHKRVVYTFRERKTNNPIMRSDGTQVIFDSNHLKNLSRVEALQDSKYEERYVGLTDELEVLARGMAGTAGIPVDVIQGFLYSTFGQIDRERGLFRKPALGSSAYLKKQVAEFFDNPDNPYYQE